MATKTVNFPQVSLLPRFPQPFSFKIPFDANKVLDFSGGKSLCIDMTQSDNNLYHAATKVYNNIYLDGVNFKSAVGVTYHEGRPCFSSNPQTFTLKQPRRGEEVLSQLPYPTAVVETRIQREPE